MKYVPLLALLFVSLPAHAQFADERYALPAAERQALEEGCARLRQSLDAVPVARRPDAEIYLGGVARCLKQGLFFSKGNAGQAAACIAEGETRVAALQKVDQPLTAGINVLGYRSKIDDTTQPYQLYVPDGLDRSKPARLEVFLHGRAATMNEPAFLRSTGMVRSAYLDNKPDCLVLFPYGRGNNGWRYAGEQDVFEALADVKRRFKVDPDRVSLRGFSMGGHGAWHIGLQHPGEWSSVSPGAGFVDTINYQKMSTEGMPAWQRALLHLYDPLDYAANAANVPLFPYVGELDPAKSQHDLMYAALRKEGVKFTDYLGPNTPHRYEPASLAAMLRSIVAGKREMPERRDVAFTTYTLRFAECQWLKIEGLEDHWWRATVTSVGFWRDKLGGKYDKRIGLRTANVAALTIASTAWGGEPAALDIDGQTVASSELRQGKPASFHKVTGKWQAGLSAGLRKRPRLTGPIDDALFGPVMVVTGTGTPWSGPAERWMKQEAARFRDAWAMYFRGELPETTDAALKPEDIRGRNLYLFGDPGSNAVLRRLLPKLPLRWTKESVTVAGRTFSTRDHLPVLIFPNPESPDHYVVINSGMTFSRADMHGSNARQYPHLPDYAVLRIDPDAFTDDRSKDIELAGFFNEQWRVKSP